jgi:hypothetical protein
MSTIDERHSLLLAKKPLPNEVSYLPEFSYQYWPAFLKSKPTPPIVQTPETSVNQDRLVNKM